MLGYYTRVTDEFFTEFGGRHANRDVAFTKPDSFTAGSHPRPTLLVFVEWLFIMLFTAIWNMIYTFVYLQHLLLPAQRFRQAQAPAEGATQPTPAFRNKKLDIPTVVEFSHLDLEENDSTSTETGTTTSSSSTSDPPSKAPAPKSRSICDANFFHAVAKTFIRMMLYICRAESQMRNSCYAYYASAPSSRLGKTKRKDSNFVAADMTDQPLDRPDLLISRTRSEGDALDEPLLVLSDGHRMRRSICDVSV
jgi:hypothetical protein